VSSPVPHDKGKGRLVGGRYRLTAVVGRGGMGTVWRAHDELLDRDVAVKEVLLPPGLEAAERDILYQRTFREARASARLSHPGVVTVHDVVWEEGRPWIIMEFVRARPLQEIIDQDGPLPPRRVAEIGLQLLEALNHAHAAGILHRDVKPSNVMVSGDGRALLTDFGVAQMPGEVTLTQTGLVMGSPAYIAPERAQGDKAMPASDLWALGATLYTAVEGRSPYERGDAMAALAATLTEDPPPPRRAERLGPIIQGLLVRDPARRMPAAAALPLLASVASGDHTRFPQQTPGPYGGDWAEQTQFDRTQVMQGPPPPAPAPPPEAPMPGPSYGRAALDPGPADPGSASTGNDPRFPDGPTWSVPGRPAAAAGQVFQPPGGTQQPPGAYDRAWPPPSLPQPAFPEAASPSHTDGDASAGIHPRWPPSPDFVATHSIPRPWGPLRRSPLRERFSGLFRRRLSETDEASAPPPLAADATASAGMFEGGRERSLALYSPLREHFRYIHEPLEMGEAAIPLLGNEQFIRALKERLINSRGGTFLITGFRGVGKTTLVERALAEMSAEHPQGRRVLPVVISVARPMPTDKLLFTIVRRVFEELTEAGVLEVLPAVTRQSLLLAYMRTSLSFKETRSNAWERSANVDIDPSKVMGGLLRPIGLAIPKSGISTKRSRSLATEAAFLAYSETDVEHDMMRIVKMLSSTVVRRARGRHKLVWWRHRRPFDLQLVVVLDEVDKLTAVKDGLDQVERLLSGIKNVVTMRGAHYLVVAGPDLHDQVLKDSGRGNSLYESIFAWRLYVPCSWSAPRRLLENLFLNPVDQSGGIVSDFELYLRFKSRGVLRRLLQELNSFVVWEDAGRPYLRIGSQSHNAISLYAQLERALDTFFAATQQKVPSTLLSQDRWRLSGYYVMDWILRSEGRPFTSADVIQSVNDRDIDPVLRITQTGVEMLLEHLVGQHILDAVRPSGQPTSTVIADVTAAQLQSYKLNSVLLARLLGIAVQNEEERAVLNYLRTSQAMEISAGRAPKETIANRYELVRVIGEGGTSSVYEGRDTLLRRPVAVKLLRSALRDDPVARRRFLREARIAEGVHHPNIVDVYEVVTFGHFQEPEDRQFAIVMELFTAPTLREKLRESGALPAYEVALMGITLAGALDYLAGKGLARLDLKPHNIVMTLDRGPVIIDLGIAKIVKDSYVWLVESDDTLERNDPVTQSGIVIGTPAYMAPEQIRRNQQIDIRADIYALGLVLYTCLAGRHPYEGEPLAILVAGTVTNDLDVSELPCSPELRQVIKQATNRDLSRRFQDPTELLAALHDTPEAEGSPRGPRD
jgi:serine/threonine protein kinase